jgi:hydroxyacylglutathione hydrolase
MKRVNKEGPALLQTLSAPPHLPAARLPDLLESGAQIVDTRQTGAFARQFLRGAINIPAYELASWAGWLVDYDRPLYLIVDSEHVRAVVRDLLYIGADNIAGYFETQALDALGEMGYPLQSYNTTTPEQIAGPVQRGEVVLVDVRNETEWAEGHVPEATHIMLGYLAERAEEIVADRPIVVLCRTGNRSAMGASILLARGAREVMNLQGGIRDWEAAGLPVVRDEGEREPA